MNTQQARDFIAKHPKAISFVKESHLEELSPLLEAHIECLVVRKDEFHAMSGNSYMPKKETLDKFAAAAGVSYNKAVEGATRKEGDNVYVGQSQGMETGPDGKMRYGDICEYEFDVDVRHEEAVINDSESKWPKLHQNGQLNAAKSRRAWLELKKVARQRANTGARSRATLNILGMQTGVKDLFGKDEPDSATREFLFSRVIVNTKNEMVLNRALDSMFGQEAAAAQLFGPNAAQRQLTERNVSPGYDDASPVPDDLESEDVPFEMENPQDAEREGLRQCLRESIETGLLTPAKQQQVEAWITDDGMDLNTLRENAAVVTKYVDDKRKAVAS